MPPKNHPSVELGPNAAPCPYLQAFPGERDERAATIGPANKGKVPRALFWAVLLNVTAVGLVIPLLPSLTTSMGGGPAHVGAIGTLYGVTQLMGANFFGPLSDRRGRRLVLRTSFLGAAAGYFLVYIAMRSQSLRLLLISRIPVGFAMQTMTVSRAIVSDCSLRSRRAASLARYVGVPAGLGFIIGPMTGGILSAKMPLLPPILATCFFLLAYAICVVGVPETAPLQRLNGAGEKDAVDASPESSSSPSSSAWWTSLRSISKHAFARTLLSSRAAVMIGYLMMQSSFHIFTHERFGLEPKSIGFVLTYCGVVSVVVDVFFVPRILRHLGGKSGQEEQIVTAGGAVCVGIAMIAMAISRTLRSFLVSLLPLAIGATLFKRSAMSLLTKCVPPEKVGMISGVANACDSVCRILAPILSGVMMEVELSSPFLLGAAVCFAGSFAVWTAKAKRD